MFVHDEVGTVAFGSSPFAVCLVLFLSIGNLIL